MANYTIIGVRYKRDIHKNGICKATIRTAIILNQSHIYTNSIVWHDSDRPIGIGFIKLVIKREYQLPVTTDRPDYKELLMMDDELMVNATRLYLSPVISSHFLSTNTIFQQTKWNTLIVYIYMQQSPTKHKWISDCMIINAFLVVHTLYVTFRV